ncbi:hypothetical protein [Microbacterium suwonense]|uniref:Uncharacterized protein n=1 Tax=Microbacterium suwonense TaxID=683047 RepID=A0ABN6X4I5_9MICO|nr:hypothetical protein [Microbacterium suwonense]BDZ39619.1 hypothetical protein GCM10025863_22330 [Microbacterium suwonense]
MASDLRSGNPALTIHAVGFAIDDDEQAQQQLQCIGRVGGGGYISAANVQQLSARIARATGTDAATVLSDTGFRGIRLGMTLDEVRARVPGFEVIDKNSTGGVEYVYVECDWGRIEFQSGIATLIAPESGASTLDGVSVGDATADVESVYGPAIDGGHNELGMFSVYRLAADSPYAYRVYGTKKVERIVLCRCVPEALAGGFSSWEITYDGVGPIQLGMTVEELQTALPDAAELELAGDDDPVTWQPLADQDWLSVEIAEGQVSKITVRPMDRDSYRTRVDRGPSLPHMRGIRIGDTLSTVTNIIPGGTEYNVLAAGIHNYVTATRTGHAIAFEPAWTDGDVELLGAIVLADATLANVNFPAPEVTVVDYSAWPDDLRGTWCQRDDPDICFSIKNLLAYNPGAFLAHGPNEDGYQPDAHSYAICLDDDLGGGQCTTAMTQYLTYYPEGVDGDCPGAIAAGWPACANDYPHDTGEPRLVVQANHQQGELYWDGAPLYKQ